ncbi:GNAT family N-acetyltransferase [Roseibium sp.]|uniref:GNAT family N-acetyltransferase n=1 Tax=Roseibium sp. TaxID=1936156 RepID=UPI003A9797F6
MAEKELVGSWLTFDELGVRRLHDLLKLRQDVFVVEQECAFPEIDGKDPDAWHFLLVDQDSGDVAGALRVFLPVTETKAGSRIGRVVTAGGYRGLGLGKQLMEAGIAKCMENAPGAAIHLSAQAHLEDFYASFGFERVSDNYLEDGILHLDMVRAA